MLIMTGIFWCLICLIEIMDKGNDFKRVETGEDVFRYPLVRDAYKLIQLSSSWNRKFEGELRHLIRSLNPPQVCVVLLSQDGKRSALILFYWQIDCGGTDMIHPCPCRSLT